MDKFPSLPEKNLTKAHNRKKKIKIVLFSFKGTDFEYKIILNENCWPSWFYLWILLKTEGRNNTSLIQAHLESRKKGNLSNSFYEDSIILMPTLSKFDKGKLQVDLERQQFNKWHKCNHKVYKSNIIKWNKAR